MSPQWTAPRGLPPGLDQQASHGLRMRWGYPFPAGRLGTTCPSDLNFRSLGALSQ